jgi:ubiquitin carboxyl-terminal hydrolase 7
LVHSGDVHGGHYYVFVRPGKNIAKSEQWYKFDDDLIYKVDEATAIEGNYGSGGATNMDPLNETDDEADDTIDNPSTKHVYDDISMSSHSDGYSGPHGEYGNALALPSPTAPIMPLGRSFSSAYMLVYVRNGENDLTSIREKQDELKNSSQTNAVEVPIPQSLLDRFREEEKAAAKRKKQQQTEHLFMNFRIANDLSVNKLRKISKTIDFSSFNNKSTLGLRLKRTVPIRELYQTIYKRTGIPLDRMRLWKVITRENLTHRPDSPLNEDSLDLAVENLIEEDMSKSTVRLYLQILPDNTNDHASVQINRYFWNDFVPPTLSNSEEEDISLNSHDRTFRNQGGQITDEEDQVRIPKMSPQDILLFIKFYDLKKKLGERMEYKGNVLIDSRKTGAELAKYIHEVLHIPFTRELMLFEEIHPMSVSEIEMDLSLQDADIQHGDIICFQYSDDYEEAVEKCTNGATTSMEDQYPNVSLYFKYLLDRCDVAFRQLGTQEDDHFVLNLLYSYVYNDIYGAVADHLGLEREKRLHLRLYQHSPLTGMPKKVPLRHCKLSKDDQTTLEDFLTEYAERTNIMYYEILSHPITEIESKKQIIVYLSPYNKQLTDQQQSKQAQRIDILVPIGSNVKQLLLQLRQELGIDMNIALRACEVINNGTLITQILKESDDVVKYAIGTTSYTPLHQAAIFVEFITNEEVAMEKEINDHVSPTLYRLPVVHFSYQATNHQWIQTHGVPMIVPFFGHEFVAEVLERIRNR